MTIDERLSVGETLADQFGFRAHLFNRIEVGLSAARVLAIQMFCYSVRKQVVAMIAARRTRFDLRWSVLGRRQPK